MIIIQLENQKRSIIILYTVLQNQRREEVRIDIALCILPSVDEDGSEAAGDVFLHVQRLQLRDQLVGRGGLVVPPSADLHSDTAGRQP